MRFFLRFVQYGIELVCALIGVLTLGFYRPWWDFVFVSWSSKVQLNRRAKRCLKNADLK